MSNEGSDEEAPSRGENQAQREPCTVQQADELAAPHRPTVSAPPPDVASVTRDCPEVSNDHCRPPFRFVPIDTTSVDISPFSFRYLPQEPPPAYTPPRNPSLWIPAPSAQVWTTSTATAATNQTWSSTMRGDDFLPPSTPPPPYPFLFPTGAYLTSTTSSRRQTQRSQSRRSARQEPSPSSPPADYLAFSIVNVILCCRLLGIVAIIKSTQVRKAIRKGDLAEAERISDSARTWNAASIITGGIIWTVVVIMVLLFAV